MVRFKANIVLDGELALRISVCGIWINVLPKKDKPVDLKQWTAQAVRKREEKAKKKKAAEKAKADKKAAKKSEKEAAKADKDRKSKKTDKESEHAEEHKKSSRGIGFYISLARIGIRVLKKLIKKLLRNITVDVSRLWIKTGSPDPDKNAQMYGMISGGLCAVLNLLGEKGKLKYSAPQGYDAVHVQADFLAEKPEFIIDITVAVSVWQVFSIINGVIGTAIAGIFREFVFNKD